MLDQSQVRVVGSTLWLTVEARSEVLEGVYKTMRDYVLEQKKKGRSSSMEMLVETAMENHDLQFSGKVDVDRFNRIPDQVWDNQVPENVIDIAYDVLYFTVYL